MTILRARGVKSALHDSKIDQYRWIVLYMSFKIKLTHERLSKMRIVAN